MEIFVNPETWIALLTLALMEIVLGIDNIVFISIVSNKLPESQQNRARTIGLSFALIFRIGLLLGITWIIGFTQPLFTLFGFEASGRDLILAMGGLFLIAKSTTEIGHKLEMEETRRTESAARGVTLTGVILQIVALDVIFSFDSILTAVGLTEHIQIMIGAVVIAMIIMIAFAGSVSHFIAKHPSLEILALSFLILIGFMLMMEALHYHVPKGYIYFAMFFSLAVEMLNMRIRGRKEKVRLKKRIRAAA